MCNIAILAGRDASYGPQKLMAVSCLVAALGTILLSTTENLHVASMGRLLMGAGASCGFIGTLKLATLLFPPERVGTVIGLTMVLATLGEISAGAPPPWMRHRSFRLAYVLDGDCRYWHWSCKPYLYVNAGTKP